MERFSSVKTRALFKKYRIDEIEHKIISSKKPIYNNGDIIYDTYKVIRAVTGGYGRIYFCHSPGTSHPIAIKTILPEYYPNKQAKMIFLNEADIWIRIGYHRNITKALFVTEIDGMIAIFLELVIGDPKYGNDLSCYLGRYKFSFDETLIFSDQFCDGMIYATEMLEKIGKQFIHRDIKPSNILVTKNKIPKITDLGFSYLEGVKARIVGTPGYIAPEVYCGENANIQSDIYSFGCVMYEMFTNGRAPYILSEKERTKYSIEDWGDIIQEKHLKNEMIDPRNFFPQNNAQQYIYDLLHMCLEKDKRKRPSNFQDLKDNVVKIYRKLNINSSDSKHEVNGNKNEIMDKLHEIMKMDDHHILHELDNKAQSLFNLGCYDEALNLWDKALQKANEARFWRGKGDALSALCKYKEAISCYDESLRLLPHDIEQWMDKGVLQRKLGKNREAIDCFDKALSIKVQPNTIWGNKGHEVVIHPANSPQEIKKFELWHENEMRKAGPLISNVYLNKGISLKYIGDTSGSLQCFDRAIKENPSSAEAWMQKGKLLNELDNKNEAFDCIQTSVLLKNKEQIPMKIRTGFSICGDISSIEDIVGGVPENAEQDTLGAILATGVELFEQKEYKEAILYFDEYLLYRESNPIALFYKAITLLELKNYSESLIYLEKCDKLRPNQPILWVNKGMAYLKSVKLEKAMDCFIKLLELEKEKPDLSKNVAFILFNSGHKEQAEKFLLYALKIANKIAMEGNELNIKSEYEDAIKKFDQSNEFMKLLGFEIENPIALGLKALALSELNKYEDSLDHFDKALELDSKNAAFWINKGVLLVKMNRYKDALKSYNKAIECDPKLGEAYHNKGAVLQLMGKINEAKECYEKAKDFGFKHRHTYIKI